MTPGLWLGQLGRCDAVCGCGEAGEEGVSRRRSGVHVQNLTRFERVKFKMPIRQPSEDSTKAAGRRSWEFCGLGKRTGESPPAS